ncbi:MAG: homocysteine biosynthesis protein, partial [Spirochaetales bacterium]|nr:homocysteine biosynthesis protein [Spirochaetales bacterium]
NCYQNYNVSINASDKPIYTYLGYLKPGMKNCGYSSAGQLSPLLNDPFYRTIGVGTRIWLAGAQGHVYAEGTQHSPSCERGRLGVPSEGAGTLALTGDMKKMDPEFVRGVSLRGYGTSLSVGVGIPIPVLDEEMLLQTTIRDRDIKAQVIDYSTDYPERTGKVLASVNYEELKSGSVEILGKKVEAGSLSSYAKARKIAGMLQEEIRSGKFHLTAPISPLPVEQGMKPMKESD